MRTIILSLVMCFCWTAAFAAPAAPAAAAPAAAPVEDIYTKVKDNFVKNGDVNLHYVTLGESGPKILFLHGFPDFWYSWRHQMAALSGEYVTAAMDLRGYNKSDKPAGVENYKMDLLIADVDKVVDALGGKVILTGHDWGGAIAWRYAMAHQDKVEKLIILNLTHPKGYAAVMANPTEAQVANTAYARNFAASAPGSGGNAAQMMGMAAGRGDATVTAHYQEAGAASDYDAMVNYYRANYSVEGRIAEAKDLPVLDIPVLQFHGLKDTAVDKDGLKGTWDWISKDYTLVTAPNSGHWVQREAADLVSTTMKWWLGARK